MRADTEPAASQVNAQLTRPASSTTAVGRAEQRPRPERVTWAFAARGRGGGDDPVRVDLLAGGEGGHRGRRPDLGVERRRRPPVTSEPS